MFVNTQAIVRFSPALGAVVASDTRLERRKGDCVGAIRHRPDPGAQRRERTHEDGRRK